MAFDYIKMADHFVYFVLLLCLIQVTLGFGGTPITLDARYAEGINLAVCPDGFFFAAWADATPGYPKSMKLSKLTSAFAVLTTQSFRCDTDYPITEVLHIACMGTVGVFVAVKMPSGCKINIQADFAIIKYDSSLKSSTIIAVPNVLSLRWLLVSPSGLLYFSGSKPSSNTLNDGYIKRIDNTNALTDFTTFTNAEYNTEIYQIVNMQQGKVAAIATIKKSDIDYKCSFAIFSSLGANEFSNSFPQDRLVECKRLAIVQNEAIISSYVMGDTILNNQRADYFAKMNSRYYGIAWTQTLPSMPYDNSLRRIIAIDPLYSTRIFAAGSSKSPTLTDFWLAEFDKNTGNPTYDYDTASPSTNEEFFELVRTDINTFVAIGRTGTEKQIYIRSIAIPGTPQQECPSGSYFNQLSTNCEPCPPGSFSTAINSRTCISCYPGTYQTLQGKDFCSYCLPGSYSSIVGATMCTPCNAGYYQPMQKQTSCIACQVGTFQDKPGGENCVECPPGQYQPNTAQDSCLQCPVGTSCPVNGMTEPVPCLKSEYQPNQGQTSCNPCTLGTESIQQVKTQCTACSAGTYYIPNQPQCLNCPANSYRGLTDYEQKCLLCPVTQISYPGSTSCIPKTTDCLPGTYRNEAYCQFCDPGTFSEIKNALNCNDCPLGTYQFLGGQSSCISCQPGYYGPTSKASECKPCDIGNYCPTEKMTFQTKCSAGYYNPFPHSTKCFMCPQGYTSTEGSSQCTICPAGTYSQLRPATQCIKCQVYTYQPDPGQSTCYFCPRNTQLDIDQKCCTQTSGVKCSAGQYLNDDGTTCLDCPAGKYQPDMGKGCCFRCPQGQYQDLTGQTSCKECPDGTYADKYGLTQCLKCPVGSYCDSTNRITGTLCPVGYYAQNDGATKCQPCSIGTYNDAVGFDQCFPCEDGYTSLAGASECFPVGGETGTNCDPGSYLPKGTTICAKCLPGYYQSYAGQTSCLPCPIGTYQDKEGTLECINCSPGQFSSKTGQTSCMNCDPGYYQNQAGQYSCILCAAGTFSTGGQSSCDTCAIGTSSPVGSSSCTPVTSDPGNNCPPGTYLKEGSTSCTNCLAGTYQNYAGKTYCNDCEVGTYQDKDGTAACLSCPTGKYANQRGQTFCTDCSAGYYQDQTGQSTCKICAAGTFSTSGKNLCDACQSGYTSLAGSASCSPVNSNTGNNCQPGYFLSQLLTICAKCRPGTYQNNAGASGCNLCPIGTYQDIEGAIECKSCPAGKFSSLVGLTSCTNCNPGFYQDQAGQPFCKPCEIGYYQNDVGKSFCLECPSGTKSRILDKIMCEPCPAGFYQPSSKQSECLPCNNGKYQKLAGAISCDLCPSGTFSDSAPSLTCKSCPAGEFSPQAGSSVCQKCIDNGYTDIEGQSVCKNCIDGLVPNPTRTGCVKSGEVIPLDPLLIQASCADSSGNIIKPYTTPCRNTIRQMCCSGSTILKDCNKALGILSNADPLYNMYCSACLFMDRTKCPAQGLCWNDAEWTINAYPPYRELYSEECLNAIGLYCGPRLQKNAANDPECYMFNNHCGAKIVTSIYRATGISFILQFDKRIQATLPDCVSIFDPIISPEILTGKLTCARNSDNEIEFFVSGLSKLITQFSLRQNILKDVCGLSIFTSTPIIIEPPKIPITETQLESVKITPELQDGLLLNKCTGLTLKSEIQVFFISSPKIKRNHINGQ